MGWGAATLDFELGAFDCVVVDTSEVLGGAFEEVAGATLEDVVEDTSEDAVVTTAEDAAVDGSGAVVGASVELVGVSDWVVAEEAGEEAGDCVSVDEGTESVVSADERVDVGGTLLGEDEGAEEPGGDEALADGSDGGLEGGANEEPAGPELEGLGCSEDMEIGSLPID